MAPPILDKAIDEAGSVTKLAKRIGVPHWILYDWRKKTRYPSPRYLPAIARGLNCTIEEIINSKGNDNSPLAAYQANGDGGPQTGPPVAHGGPGATEMQGPVSNTDPLAEHG